MPGGILGLFPGLFREEEDFRVGSPPPNVFLEQFCHFSSVNSPMGLVPAYRTTQNMSIFAGDLSSALVDCCEGTQCSSISLLFNGSLNSNFLKVKSSNP